jgi:hypothetical protein
MEVLTATSAQKKALEGNYVNNSELKFVFDGNGKYIVGLEILNDDNFIEIREQLLSLTKIDYVKPKDNAS